MFLNVVEPADDSVVGVSPITIRGKTIAGVVVSINGEVVDADASGNFSLPVILDAGPNIFDIIATDDQGNEATVQITVYFAP